MAAIEEPEGGAITAMASPGRRILRLSRPGKPPIEIISSGGGGGGIQQQSHNNNHKPATSSSTISPASPSTSPISPSSSSSKARHMAHLVTALLFIKLQQLITTSDITSNTQKNLVSISLPSSHMKQGLKLLNELHLNLKGFKFNYDSIQSCFVEKNPFASIILGKVYLISAKAENGTDLYSIAPLSPSSPIPLVDLVVSEGLVERNTLVAFSNKLEKLEEGRDNSPTSASIEEEMAPATTTSDRPAKFDWKAFVKPRPSQQPAQDTTVPQRLQLTKKSHDPPPRSELNIMMGKLMVSILLQDLDGVNKPNSFLGPLMSALHESLDTSFGELIDLPSYPTSKSSLQFYVARSGWKFRVSEWDDENEEGGEERKEGKVYELKAIAGANPRRDPLRWTLDLVSRNDLDEMEGLNQVDGEVEGKDMLADEEIIILEKKFLEFGKIAFDEGGGASHGDLHGNSGGSEHASAKKMADPKGEKLENIPQSARLAIEMFYKEVITPRLLSIFDRNRISFLDDINNVLARGAEKSRANSVRVEYFGSSINNLGFISSDADMTIIPRTGNNFDHIYSNMNRLGKELRSSGLRDVQAINHARVPICKFRSGPRYGNLDADLNFGHSLGRENSRLLCSYTFLEGRVKPLIMLVKCFAKARGINDASLDTISSYAWSLMTIAFLQHRGIIPSLQQGSIPQRFLTVPEISMKPRNRGGRGRAPPPPPLSGKVATRIVDVTFRVIESPLFEGIDENVFEGSDNVAQLFYDFLYYFAYQHDYSSSSVLSVEAGGIITNEDLHGGSILVVVDPFEDGRNCTKMVGIRSLELIRKEMVRALGVLESGEGIANIFQGGN